jgi:uncharacterized protein (TIGR00255 family)
MTLRSMTGFARSAGAYGAVRWHWELRSVNGRGLDVRLRVPPGFEAMEPVIRERVAQRLARGSLSVSLSVQRDSPVSDIRLNEELLGKVLAAIDRIRAAGDFERPRPDGLLGLRGVLEIVEQEESEAEIEARQAAMMVSLDTAISDMIEARAAEGRRLQPVLQAHLATVDSLVDKVAASAARTPDAIRFRLKEQVAKLLEATHTLDEQRLYQEAALIAQRADVEEELKRLKAHVGAARDLLVSNTPVGRKLDFLAQEFNREANTLGAKSNDLEITRLGLDLKAVIDQIREQVQNIE